MPDPLPPNNKDLHSQMNLINQSIDANGVATIEINRPEKRNAFDESVIVELTQAFAEVSESTKARIAVPVSYTHLTLPTKA